MNVFILLCAQVVSGCEGGVVTIWDIDSGHQVLKFSDCHGNNEITALCLDATGSRLITGSRAGDIKVSGTGELPLTNTIYSYNLCNYMPQLP